MLDTLVLIMACLFGMGVLVGITMLVALPIYLARQVLNVMRR